MHRIGFMGRVVLIMTTALAAIIFITIATTYWRPAPTPYDTHYPRLRQVAGIVDLFRDAAPGRYPALLRAASGESLRVRIVSSEPPAGTLVVAPRLSALLRGFESSGSDVVVYSHPRTNRTDGLRGIGGYLLRATSRLPDGRVLVFDHIGYEAHVVPDVLGLPSTLWIGFVGVLIAGFAIVALFHEIRPLRQLAVALRDFDGKQAVAPVSVGGAFEVRQLVTAVDAMQRRVAQLIAERTLTIGAISHDLRTLLTRLHLRAATLVDLEVRERIETDLGAMQALVDDALAFARGTQLSVDRRPVDLADLVASELAERAAFGLLPITTSVLADAVVSGDAGALRRVVANLIENAAKFTRTTIHVATSCDAARCVISVEDDGTGVPESQREAIFEPFYRIEGSRNRTTGGSGLGLAIARQIVEAHGGTLHVTAASSGGARFTASLPRLGEAVLTATKALVALDSSTPSGKL